MKKILYLLILFAVCTSCSAKLAPAKFKIEIGEPQDEFQSLPPEKFLIREAIAPAVIAAIIAGGTTLATAGLNAFANRQQWNVQNQYNTPAEQMQRYRAAGLNPNLIYGSGQASAGNAGAIAPFQATPVSTNDLLAAANAVSVIKNTEANARKANAEAMGAELNNMLHSTQLQYYGSSLALENRLKAANLDYIMGRKDQLGYQNAVYQAQAQNILENAMYTKQNREVFQPALISISRQNAATAANRLNWDTSPFNPLNDVRRQQSNILGKDLFYYDSDRRFERRVRALGASSAAVGAGGSFFKNLFNGNNRGTNINYYGYWNH